MRFFANCSQQNKQTTPNVAKPQHSSSSAGNLIAPDTTPNTFLQQTPDQTDTIMSRRYSDERRQKLNGASNNNLHCVSSNKGALFLNKTLVLQIVKKMKRVVATELPDTQIDEDMSILVETVNKIEKEEISIEQWADLSLQLKKLLAMFPDSAQLQSDEDEGGLSLLYSISLSIKNEQPTCLSKADVLEKVERMAGLIIAEFPANSVKTSIAELVDSLKKNEGEQLSINDRKALSVKLEKLSAMFAYTAQSRVKKMPDTISPLHFIKLNMKNLECTSRYSWGKLAHDELVEQFASEIEKKSVENPALLDTHTFTGALDVSTPIPCLSVGVDVSYQKVESVDEEGNFRTTQTGAAGISVKLNGAVASATGRVGGAYGGYVYCKTAKQYATYFFNELLSENKLKPHVARLLSRQATLNPTNESSYHDEISAFETLQKEYLGKQKNFSQFFSILLSLKYSEQERQAIRKAQLVQRKEVKVPENMPAKVQLNASASKKIRPTERTIMAGAGSVEGTLGFKLASAGEGAGGEADNFLKSPSITLKGTAQIKRTRSTKLMPFCELMEQRNVEPVIKQKLREQLEQNSVNLRHKADQLWYSTTELEERERIARSLELLAQEVSYLKLERMKQMNHISEDFAPDSDLHAQITLTQNHINWLKFSLLKQDIHCLINDFANYSNLHTQLALKHDRAELPITEFHKKYDAKSTDECLKKMALLNACFFSQLQTQEQTKEVTDLKSMLLKQEELIHTTSIPHSSAYLEKHCFASQNMSYASSEKIGQLSAKTAFEMGRLNLLPADQLCVDLGVKISSRTPIKYYDAFRSGDFLTVEFSIGADLEFNKLVLNSISSYLSDGGEALGTFFSTGNFSVQGMYTLHYLKSNFPGQPRRLLYKRMTTQETLNAGLATPDIPVGGVNFSVAGSYVGTKRQFRKEKVSSDTILYCAWHYMHALYTGKTDRNNGNKVEDSYWYRLEREHEKMFRKLFMKYAQDDKKRAKNGLLNELKSIESVLLKPATSAEKALYQEAKFKFFRQTQKFEQDQSKNNYNATLLIFKEYFRELYPHWLQHKESAKAYKRWEFQVS